MTEDALSNRPEGPLRSFITDYPRPHKSPDRSSQTGPSALPAPHWALTTEHSVRSAQ